MGLQRGLRALWSRTLEGYKKRMKRVGGLPSLLVMPLKTSSSQVGGVVSPCLRIISLLV